MKYVPLILYMAGSLLFLAGSLVQMYLTWRGS